VKLGASELSRGLLVLGMLGLAGSAALLALDWAAFEDRSNPGTLALLGSLLLLASGGWIGRCPRAAAFHALAGVLLAGYSTKAYQAMGDAYLLPSIAAVVIGGTNILGGRGRYLGTLIGVVLIVLLNSVLSIMDMPEAGRQVIYGLVIILMLLVYGRGERVTS
jgi:hypothetical protein